MPITSDTMTACLDRIERNGPISRESDPNDRRSTAAVLTHEGGKRIDHAILVRFEEALAAPGGLSESSRTILARLLKKLGHGLEQESPYRDAPPS